MSSSRRSWGSKNDLNSDAKENAAEAHEEYLLLLQQRNRLLARLKEKDEKQIELERREKGFSLYLNGANVGLQVCGQRRSRQSKTAGEGLEREVYKSELTGMGASSRAKTAPTKQTRKGWHHVPVDAIQIKTQKGEKLRVGVPSVYSGKYSEDFEMYNSLLGSKLSADDDKVVRDSEMQDDDDDDDEENIDDDSLIISDDDSEISDDEIDHELTFTVHDVKVLRASLENDSTIRQNIASLSDDLPVIHSEDEISSTAFDEADIPEEEIQHEIDTCADDDDDLFTVTNMGEDNIEKLPELTGAKPKSRPISATRKQSDSLTVDPIESENVSAAIAEENKMLADYQQRRKTRTAPVPQLPVNFELNEDIDERPATTSRTLSEKEIHSITQRVRSLTGRQQKKLLQMLGEIDLAGDDILNESWDNRKDKNKQYLEEEKNNRPSTLRSPNIVSTKSDSVQSERGDEEKFDSNMNLKLSTNTDNSSDDSEVQNLSPHDSIIRGSRCVEVVFELLSNWGNENYIGLTEVQFYDCSNKLIKVLPDDMKVSGSSDCVENLKNLSNSKTKTTKEKYMWKCSYCQDEESIIKVIVFLKGCEVSSLGKIVLWNFNKNLQELNAGVKDCKLFVNGELKWEGVVEKGCGNQIFDYSTTIQINSPPSKPVPSTEDISDSNIHTDSKAISNENEDSKESVNVSPKSKVNISKSEVITSVDHKAADSLESKAVSLSESKAINIPESKTTNLSESKVINLSDELTSSIMEPSVCNSPDLSKQKQKRASGTSVTIGNKSKKSKDSQPSRSSSSMSDKPIWLEDSSKVKELKENSDLFLEGKKVSLSRPPSVRRSYQSTPDFVDEPVKRRPISGRRSQQSASPDTDLKSKKESEDVFDIDSMPRQAGSRRDLHLRNKNESKKVSSLPSRTGPIMLDMPSDSSSAVQKSERAKFKETMDKNLEQSYQSINNFNFHHQGRITARLDDDDDDLRSLLQPMKPQDVLVLQGKSIPTSPDPKREELPEAVFELPVLPKGKDLIINIKSTWGDRHYVGLNGIEVFSKSGNLVVINNIQADPSDINVLPEFDGDPRVVTNLTDGCYLTRDDLHLWLTPFTQGGDHFVELEFEEEVEVSMIRIWNYNKSRIHSSRGARFVEMALGGKLIFIGEIARASGVLSKEDPYGDTILFTTDEDILTLVATNDFTYEVEMDEDEDFLITSGIFNERPKTADKPAEPTERPYTCPKSRESERMIDSPLVERMLSPDDGFMQCKALTIFFCETWGDQHYLGLTGLEVLGETFEKIPLEMQMLEAFPEDLNVLDEYNDDDRTLDKIINNINVTTSDENMWMIPFDEDGTHILKITFDTYTIVTGLRVWNYNKSIEDTFRGAKTIHAYLDDHVISPEAGFLLRKGPGHCHFDFAQDVLFNDPDAPSTPSTQYPEASKHRKINLQKIVNEYETIMMPSGFVFQFKLFSSWGDQYYIGLNSIEVYDKTGEKIQLSDNNITAYPHSVNILEGVSDDVRTPDKLVNNINDTYDGRQMWLAPILPGQINNIYIVFDKPITISMIKIWNYYKTPTRGVRNFGLLVDDLLVYSGVLPQHDLHANAIVPAVQPPGTHHTILFSDNEEIALKERKHVLSSRISLTEQNVQLTNDRAIINPFKVENEGAVEADPSMRPMTSVTSMRTKDRR